MLRGLRVLVMAAMVSALAATDSYASIIFDFSEVGGNVELQVSGAFDLRATTYENTGFRDLDLIWPSNGLVFVGNVSGDPAFPYTDNYRLTGDSSWASFGSGSFHYFDFENGDRIAFYSDPLLGLPVGYVSLAPLSASGIILGATFASLGMTSGSWVTTFTNGDFTDTVVVNVGQPVPEPATLLLLGTGLGAVAARRRLKKRA